MFEAARGLGLPVKIHAEQLSNLGGARLAAEFGGLSADHLEYLDEAGVAAMAAAGTVAVILPGAFYTLRETQAPPIARLRAQGVPMAVATDCNPGSSPMASLLLAMNMACTLFRLTPEEALAGVTREAARALGLDDCGRIAPGMRADLAVWEARHPAELAYRIGFNPLRSAHLRRPRMTVTLTPGATGLADVRGDLARRRGGACSTAPPGRRSRRRRRASRRRRRASAPVYGVNTGFGKLASVTIAGGGHGAAAAQPDPVALRRGRRADAAGGRAADDGAEARVARARRVGGALGDRRADRGDAGARA